MPSFMRMMMRSRLSAGIDWTAAWTVVKSPVPSGATVMSGGTVGVAANKQKVNSLTKNISRVAKELLLLAGQRRKFRFAEGDVVLRLDGHLIADEVEFGREIERGFVEADAHGVGVVGGPGAARGSALVVS